MKERKPCVNAGKVGTCAADAKRDHADLHQVSFAIKNSQRAAAVTLAGVAAALDPARTQLEAIDEGICQRGATRGVALLANGHGDDGDIDLSQSRSRGLLLADQAIPKSPGKCAWLGDGIIIVDTNKAGAIRSVRRELDEGDVIRGVLPTAVVLGMRDYAGNVADGAVGDRGGAQGDAEGRGNAAVSSGDDPARGDDRPGADEGVGLDEGGHVGLEGGVREVSADDTRGGGGAAEDGWEDHGTGGELAESVA